MPRSPEERELDESWGVTYRQAQTPVMLDLERAVCGCDYGGTSWTTRDEAEHMGWLLELGESSVYLEIGSGSGWPGLYLAEETGCDATLADLPLDALRIGADRVANRSDRSKISLSVADAAYLPFKSSHFDAIGHSDVLCCLVPKREVLDECRRVIRRGGRMVFSVISVAPGLSVADHARAVEAGPPHIEAEYEYAELLEATGWRILERIDLSAAYETTGRRHLREVQARADQMKELIGEAEFDDLLVRRNRNVEAIAEGIVRRDLFVASPRDNE